MARSRDSQGNRCGGQIGQKSSLIPEVYINRGLFLTHMKSASLCNDSVGRTACRLSVCSKNVNVAIFSNTLNMINVKFA